MDHDQVRVLAEQENRMWVRPSPPDVADAETAPRHKSGAYAPPASVVVDPLRDFEWLQAVACGTVLIVRFRWRPDPHRRDLLLHLDQQDNEPDNFTGAAAQLLEHIRIRIVEDTGWFPDGLIPLSEHTALVPPRWP